jgi:hypothetical protein
MKGTAMSLLLRPTLVSSLLLGAAACGPATNTVHHDVVSSDSGSQPDSQNVLDAQGFDSPPPIDVPTAVDVPTIGDGTTSMDVAPPIDVPVGNDVAPPPDASLPAPTPGQVMCFRGGNCMVPAQECCDSSMRTDGGTTYTDQCVAPGAMCGTTRRPGAVVSCEEGPDCTMGQVCCATTGVASSGTPFLSSATCAASCSGAMQHQLCSSDADCGAGHCAPMRISGRDLGYCM